MQKCANEINDKVKSIFLQNNEEYKKTSRKVRENEKVLRLNNKRKTYTKGIISQLY